MKFLDDEPHALHFCTNEGETRCGNNKWFYFKYCVYRHSNIYFDDSVYTFHLDHVIGKVDIFFQCKLIANIGVYV